MVVALTVDGMETHLQVMRHPIPVVVVVVPVVLALRETAKVMERPPVMEVPGLC
jgi:hypothetical protein|tara:strand:+ start:296 stop:457 length:162 start_codon:yes stop_codon:yes gene_type:complete